MKELNDLRKILDDIKIDEIENSVIPPSAMREDEEDTDIKEMEKKKKKKKKEHTKDWSINRAMAEVMPDEDEHTKKEVNNTLYDWRVRISRIYARLEGVNPDTHKIDPMNLDSVYDYIKKPTNDEPMIINSVNFRIRFLKEYLRHMNTHVVDICTTHSDLKHDIFTKWDNLLDSLILISKSTELFIYEYGKRDTSTLMDAFFTMELSREVKLKKRENLNKAMHEQYLIIKNGLKSGTDKTADYLLLYTVFKLAYAVLVGNGNPKGFEIKSIEGLNIRNKIMIEEMLRKLGEAIKDTAEELNPMFDCFIKSNPFIRTSYPDDENINLGIYAIMFVMWVSGDDNLLKYGFRIIK